MSLSTISKMAAVVAMSLVLNAVALADDSVTPNTPNKGKVSTVKGQQGQLQTQGQTQSQMQTQPSKVDVKGGDSKGSGEVVKGSGDSKGSGEVSKGSGTQSQGQAQTQSQSQSQTVQKGKDYSPSKVSTDKGGNKGGKVTKKPGDDN